MYLPFKTDRPNLLLVLSLSSLLALSFLLWALILDETPKQIFAESGPIERVSALYLIIAGLMLTGDAICRRAVKNWHLAVLILAAALRELDWDKAFTDSGILSLRLYSGVAPMAQKIIGAVVLMLLIWAGLRLLRQNLKGWLGELRAGKVWAWLMALALSLYVVAKSLDGLGRKLAPWGIEISELANTTAGRSEEALELFGAILILQVVALALFQEKSRQ